MGNTNIEWTDKTWNPTRGCSRVSQGCVNCYAERVAIRFAADKFSGFVHIVNGHPAWTGKVDLIESKLLEPLSWRKPARIFVNSMSDLFHEALPDEAIDRVFAVMALCPQHTFQILTKRPERMLQYLTHPDVSCRVDSYSWELIDDGVDPNYRRSDDLRAVCQSLDDGPLPNVHLGVSVENKAAQLERVPLLQQTPAAVRFVSQEPQLEFIDWPPEMLAGISQIIVGGESGPGARPFDIEWARRTIKQCKAAGVAVFVKQLGAKPMYRPHGDNNPSHLFNGLNLLHSNGAPLVDRKGGDMAEWPWDLRVREEIAR